jgi:hypothetical protein
MLHAYWYDTTVQEGWWIMPGPVHEQQWEVRIAYKKGWEVRMAYYDRLLRSVMELIEGAVKIMKVDGMSEAVEDLGKALLAIEDAWATLTVEKSSALVAREREPRGIEGDMHAGEYRD